MNYSSKARMQMAAKGQALPDGSFPIKNRADLENAIGLVGNAKDPAKAKAHIISSAKALGLSSLIPASWSGGVKDSAGDTVGAKPASKGLPPGLAAYMAKKKGP